MTGSGAESTNGLAILDERLGIFLRPICRLVISVHLNYEGRAPGKSLTNWDLMERIKKAVAPTELESVKVVESNQEKVKFEAEVSERSTLIKLVKMLHKHEMKIVGYANPFTIRAGEAATDAPTRHDWDSFFREAKHMDESLPGERPDTLHLHPIPTHWFAGDDGKPSESRLSATFSVFGEIRHIDIPMNDPHRQEMTQAVSGIRVPQLLSQKAFFECYIQFVEYAGFVKAVAKLRNNRWLKVLTDERIAQATIKIDFDRSAHLSQRKIAKREQERAHILEQLKKVNEDLQRQREEAEANAKTAAEAKEKRRLEREAKRRLKKLDERHVAEVARLDALLASEEKKVQASRRKVEARRLASAIFRRFEEREKARRMQEQADLKAEVSQASKEELLAFVKDGPIKEENRLRQQLLQEKERQMREKIRERMLAATLSKKNEDAEKKPEIPTTKLPKRKKKTSERNQKKRKKQKKRKGRHRYDSRSSSSSSSSSSPSSSNRSRSSSRSSSRSRSGRSRRR